MNYTTLFYWIVVADNARQMFQTFVIIFTAISVISTFLFIIGREDFNDDLSCPADGVAERSKRWMWWSYPFMIVFWSLFILTPSKKNALLIVAGGQTLNFLTTDKSSKQIPAELSSYLLTAIKNEAKEAAVDLNIADSKENILKEAKKLTTKELLSKIKTDSTFAKIYLEKDGE